MLRDAKIKHLFDVCKYLRDYFKYLLCVILIVYGRK